jgi:hypothetical protein
MEAINERTDPYSVWLLVGDKFTGRLAQVAKFCSMQAIVIRLSDLTFLSSEDLSGACSQAELGEKSSSNLRF